MRKPPKRFLTSAYRRTLWKEVSSTLSQIEKSVPISKAYLIGSYTTKKRRPADIDFMVMLKVPAGSRANWSFDLVTAPDNAHGTTVLNDVKKWMKQKYGSKKSEVVRLK